MSRGERRPVVVVDRVGYAFYRDGDGRAFLPGDDVEVRLVTRADKLDEVRGAEVAAVVAVPRGDHAAFLDGARLLHRLGGRPAARIAAITERYLLPVAALREELGVPGMTVSETLPFRDKLLMKEHLRATGIRVPEFAPYARDAAMALLARHGCAVTKPRLGAGSAEVSMLRAPADVEAFERRAAGRFDEFEVEAFVDGDLFHVDCVVRRGRVVAATAGRSIDDTRNFETGLPFRDVAVAPGALLEEMLAFNAAVVAAYPEFVGVTHHEMFATRDGIVFCEIAARAGGGGIIAGFRSRTGWSLDEVLLRAQVYDDVPAELPVAPHLTGYALVYAGPGRLVECPRALPEPWVIETQLHAGPGVWLDAPADWGDAVAIVTVVGDTEEQVVERLDHVIAETLAQVRVDQTEVGRARP